MLSDQTGEGDEIDCEFAEIGVELTGESEAASDTGHGGGHQMVEISIGRGGELEGAEADIIQRFVINHHHLIGVLDELMHGESGVVRLDDGVGHLRRREDGESAHHTIGVFLADL